MQIRDIICVNIYICYYMSYNIKNEIVDKVWDSNFLVR